VREGKKLMRKGCCATLIISQEKISQLSFSFEARAILYNNGA
jgi:hypothetical protein